MKILAKTPDGIYAYGSTMADAQLQIKMNGGDPTYATLYQVGDNHVSGNPSTTEAIIISDSKNTHHK